MIIHTEQTLVQRKKETFIFTLYSIFILNEHIEKLLLPIMSGWRRHSDKIQEQIELCENIRF